MGQFVVVEDPGHEAVVPVALAPEELDYRAYASVDAVNLGILGDGLERDLGRGLVFQPFCTPFTPSPGLRPPSPPGRGLG